MKGHAFQLACAKRALTARTQSCELASELFHSSPCWGNLHVQNICDKTHVQHVTYDMTHMHVLHSSAHWGESWIVRVACIKPRRSCSGVLAVCSLSLSSTTTTITTTTTTTTTTNNNNNNNNTITGPTEWLLRRDTPRLHWQGLCRALPELPWQGR